MISSENYVQKQAHQSVCNSLFIFKFIVQNNRVFFIGRHRNWNYKFEMVAAICFNGFISLEISIGICSTSPDSFPYHPTVRQTKVELKT